MEHASQLPSTSLSEEGGCGTRSAVESVTHLGLRQVIDLISLKPFDIETISNSVKKTKRVIIVEECMKTGGIGASLSAMINESLFDYLDHQATPFPP